MANFIRMLQSEFLKVRSNRGCWIVFGLVIIIQPLFALISVKQLMQIGLDATPETHSQLVQEIPSIEYLGFDATLLGLLPMVVIGGIIGASEYKNHNLRTTLLCQSNRISSFYAKVVVILMSTLVVSFLSIFVTIGITHIGLGNVGLNPLFLSLITWQYIGYATLNWILLTMLAFFLGMLGRNAIISFAFLIPQIYNLGTFLAEKWEWGRYLPVAAGELLIATPTDGFPHNPVKGSLILLIWVIGTLLLGNFFFVRRDVGGAY